MSELKLCPCCGTKPKFHDWDWGKWVECPKCGLQTNNYKVGGFAYRVWNRREPKEQQQELIMKCVYEVQTKYTGNTGTSRNFGRYIMVAKNMKEAVKKTEAFLKKRQSGAERVDSVIFLNEISFQEQQ